MTTVFGHVLTPVVTKFVAGIPTKSHVGAISEGVQENSEVLMAFGVFKSNVHAIFDGSVHHIAEIVDSLGGDFPMGTNAPVGVGNHNGNSGIGTVVHALNPFFNSGTGSFPVVPEFFGHMVRGVDGLVNQPQTVGNFPILPDMGIITGKKSIQANLFKPGQLLRNLQFRGADGGHTKFQRLHGVPPEDNSAPIIEQKQFFCNLFCRIKAPECSVHSGALRIY